MDDLYIDPITGDLAIDELNLSIVNGADRVRQQLGIKLGLWTEEWFLDTEFGTPYLESILGKQLSVNGGVAALKKSIMEVNDVDKIDSFSYIFDRPTRKLTSNFDCSTKFGIVNFNGRPSGYSPSESAITNSGVSIAQFVIVEDELDTLINVTIPGHEY